ncbi:MAG: nucleotidyltransferase domain-containing protein [Bacteroidia bacterium]|nr:nucleotidyltransferase domain-containing protein [Bacteroidia bacterium]
MKDKEVIVDLARKYEARKLLLFGSSLNDDANASDIDIGVSGVNPRYFIRFLGEAMWLLSKPVDLIDLDMDTKFTQLIQKSGVVLYEHARG